MPPASPAGDIRFANGVQQAGLAVVDVTHHGHHRRPRLQIFLGLFLRDFQHHLLFKGDHADNAAECFRKRRCRRNIQRLVDAGEHAAVQQRLQKFLGAHVQLLGQFANGDAFGDGDVARRDAVPAAR